MCKKLKIKNNIRLRANNVGRARHMLEMPSTKSEINFDFLGAPPAPVLILSNGETRKSYKPICVGDNGNIKTGVRGR